MKKIYRLLIMALAIGAASCSYLDLDESVGRKLETTYNSFNDVKSVVSDIYGRMQQQYLPIGDAMRDAASDDALHLYSSSDVYKFYDGSWSAMNLVDNQWNTMFANIRAANSFLKNFNIDNFIRFQYNSDYSQQMDAAKRYPSEVRFLRAYFYFELVKRYGDVPLVTTVLDPKEANKVQRTPYEQVLQFICDECDTVAPKLPLTYAQVVGAETGRVTKGAAMALKARALLYQASPLFNKNTSVDVKWGKAAKAALDIINLNQYTLTTNEVLWGNGNTVLNSKQLIFEVRAGNSNSFEYANVPLGLEGGRGCTNPSQNLIDAYEVKVSATVSVPFDWNNPTHTANIYANRDPRLDKAILRNGSVWQGTTIATNIGGANGQPAVGTFTTSATKTGYYLAKHMNASVILRPNAVTSLPHHWLLFRYAEVLLNYAEAMNEWKGPDYKDATYTLSALEALNKVRTYASMPVLSSLSQVQFRQRVHNERRVELAFEDHRFWDIRRWKEAATSNDIYGIQITKDSNGNNQFQKVLVQHRIWDDKMYFYPIPQSEIFASGNVLSQNSGW